MSQISRKRKTIVGGGVIASALALSAVFGLGTGKRPIQAPPPPPPEATTTTTERAIPEQPELADDYELVDPSAPPSAGLEGVIASLSDLPIPLTKRTMRYVERYAVDPKGRKAFHDALRRSGRYGDYIERELTDADLPEDLLYLAAIESGFNPQATSPKGAAGIFQFMPETGDRFGLTITNELDERRSITKATAAAIAYLKILYATYGSWDLALAGYNCGEERLDEAIEKGLAMLGRKRAEQISFQELAELRLLPSETANYVPQIHAFAIVAHNRGLLDLEDLDPLPPMEFAEVAVPGGMRLAPIAKAAGISIAALEEYNPDLLTDRLPNGGDFLINVPADSLEQTLAALPALAARDSDRDDKSSPPVERTHRSPTAARASKDAVLDVASSSSDGRGARAHGGTGGTSSGSTTAAPKLTPAPNDKGLFVLSNGVLVDLHVEQTDQIEVSARIEVGDPTKNRARIGEPISIEARHAKPSELDEALSATGADLRKVLLGGAATSLRSALAIDRKRFYDKTGFGNEFSAVADHVFPENHPMHGAWLVGPTDPADTMFLALEPTWAEKATVTIRGPVDADALAVPLERAFGSAFVPTKLPALAAPSRTTLGDSARNVLIGWSAAPLTPSDETATRVAFLIACHDRIGRFHRLLATGSSPDGVPDKTSGTRVACSIELAPQASVPWVLVLPSTPYTVTDAENAIDKATTALMTDGPSDVELSAARQLLRVELAKERESATVRGIPRSRVIADGERILSKLDDVKKADVVTAAKRLFAKDHRIVVTGG